MIVVVLVRVIHHSFYQAFDPGPMLIGIFSPNDKFSLGGKSSNKKQKKNHIFQFWRSPRRKARVKKGDDVEKSQKVLFFH